MNSKRIPINLLIFDFDGTLTDSIPAAVEAIQAMMVELGLPHKTKEEIHKHIGYGEAHLVSGSIGSKEPKLLKTALEIYSKHIKAGIKTVPVYPHVKELLGFFEQKPKIIISNKKDEFIKMILDHHYLTSYFIDIFGEDRAPSRKPDPSTLNKILEEYKISPDRTILIGDMAVDVQTGKNAKVVTCAVTYGFDDRSKLERSNPDFLIDDILKLKGLIY